ncbi:proline-rich domain-containing protein [Curtobacterium sp. Leaf261]|uniref:proline-rich domain-containing protein n=1 Tax=Curtobacterium sp. Leaf261 TaxID=1736311 RepID=UPI000700822E|nr:proline-rich domain-containing protein [Curtobacterium sp. Leaf261]
MTNGDGWQVPGSSDRSTPPPQPGGPWQHGPDRSGPAGPPGRVSALPLRPLGFGDVLGGAFGIFRRNVRVLLVYGLLLSGVATIVSLLVSRGFSSDYLTRVASASSADSPTVLAGAYTLQLVGSVVALVIGVVARALLQAPVAVETAQQALGRRASAAGINALLRGRRLAVVWWALLVAAAIVVGGGVTVVVFAATVAGIGGTGGFLAGIGVLFGVGLLFGVLAAWLAVKFSLVVPGIALEGLGPIAAARNSWRLVRGAYWRTFGIELLVRVMFNVAVSIASIPLSIVLAFASGVFSPLGARGSGATGFSPVSVIVIVVGGALAVAVTAITDVVAAATTTLLYIDRRFRTEGLDGRIASSLETGIPADPFATVAPAERRPDPWGGASGPRGRTPAGPGAGPQGQWGPGPWGPGQQQAPGPWGPAQQQAPGPWGPAQQQAPGPQWGAAPQWGPGSQTRPGSPRDDGDPRQTPPGPPSEGPR